MILKFGVLIWYHDSAGLFSNTEVCWLFPEVLKTKTKASIQRQRTINPNKILGRINTSAGIVEEIPMTEKEKQEVKALKKEIAEMKKRLKEEELRTLALSTMIDVAEERLGEEIRKKIGTKQSND